MPKTDGSEPKHRLIFGCGYLGERVAKRWLNGGDRVSVVTRSVTRAAELADFGFEPLVADVTDPAILEELPVCDTLLFAVGYDRSAGPSIQEVYEQGFRNVLDRLPDDTGRVIYISTTGVYGDAGGEWVDEQTPPSPSRAGGVASLAAEEALRSSRFADRGVVLRLAGIYGPGRVPMAAKLKSGEPIPAPSDGPLNLIHVDDAAEVVVAAADVPGIPPPVFCVSDGNPPLRVDYYREIARLTGAAEPIYVDPPADSPGAARAAASKRVSNALLLKTLGIQLRYPDFRAGLAAILGSGGGGG